MTHDRGIERDRVADQGAADGYKGGGCQYVKRRIVNVLQVLEQSDFLYVQSAVNVLQVLVLPNMFFCAACFGALSMLQSHWDTFKNLNFHLCYGIS